MAAAPSSLPDGQRIAVIGSGISGLTAAWLLAGRHQVTLFEANDYLGGHTHTVDVSLEGKVAPVDTGFLVFNHRTYPNLTALFDHLGVETVESLMTFSVRLDALGLEWAGTNLSTVFGQRRNLWRPAFWRMLWDILRFNRESTDLLLRHPDERVSLGAYLDTGKYSRPFRDWYLLPMAAAIWSCPTEAMLDYPLVTFIRFCQNHGLLQLVNRPRWRTVKGGGREYVRRMCAGLSDIRLSTPVIKVRPQAEGVEVTAADGKTMFDQVVLACHSDQALAMLDDTSDSEQRAVLAKIRYQPNRAVLHSDANILPRDQKLWSSWNYQAGSAADPSATPVGVSYLINRLQPLPFATPVVVTLNPVIEPKAELIHAEFDYDHPLFDGPAIAAQRALDAVQGRNGLWFCGAWGGYGFHEDGHKSGLKVANRMGIVAPWQAKSAAGS